MTNARFALDALADPTRRRILERLRHGPLRVTEIAAGLPVSRPAVSQHLKLLKDCGLVVQMQAGARHSYAIAPQGLGELRAYLDELWEDALAAFAAHVAQERFDG